MKVKFKRHSLQEKIASVIGLTESNSPNEILKNILLRGSAKKKEAFLAATDLESTVVSSFPEGEGRGVDFDVMVPAQKFMDIVRRIEDEDVEVNIHKNDWMEIKLASAQFKFPCLSGRDFPKIPSPSGGSSFKVPVTAVSGMLPSILNFSSNEPVRRNINGVLIEPFDGKVRFVATDSHKLAYFQREVDGGADFEKVVVPRRAVGEMAKLLKASEKESDSVAEFSFDKEKVFFRVGDTTVVSTAVDSPFPEYVRVIPDMSSSEPAVVDRNRMMGAVRRVAVFCSEVKKVDLEISSSSLSFMSDQTEAGEGRESVAADFKGTMTADRSQDPGGKESAGAGEAEVLKVSFNPEFLVDSLNFLDGETVEFRPGDGGSPAVLTLPGTGDFVCVVMPVVS